MTYTPSVVDWRSSCVPLHQVFRAGGASLDGGLTAGGASISNPETGGRGELSLEFSAFTSGQQNRDASWLISKMMGGQAFRIKLWDSVQLVSGADLSASIIGGGLPWANSQPWANGQYWRYDPRMAVTAGVEGSSAVSFDTGAFGSVVQIGHVIGSTDGAHDAAHTVMDISYAGTTATATISPPLRRNATEIKLRPSMIASCINASEVMGNFSTGRHMQLNAAHIVEVLT